jgi:hypothetical protein
MDTTGLYTVNDTPYYQAKVDVASVNIPGLNGITANGSGYKLIPKGVGTVDIVNQHRWCNPSTNFDEVPRIIAVESRLTYGAWTQNFAIALGLLTNIAKDKKTDPYLSLYASDPTHCFKYAFPWLLKDGDNINSVKNSWGELDNIASTFGGDDLGKVVGSGLAAVIGSRSPGVGFEPIYEFKETSHKEITIKFPLYNTYSVEDAWKNYSFVSLFTFQNLKTRTTFATYLPPCIYSLKAVGLGGFNMPVAVVSDLTIDSIGTTRSLSNYNGAGGLPILVPEAYKVSITFKELLPQSSNIFGETLGSNSVTVVVNNSSAGLLPIIQQPSQINGGTITGVTTTSSVTTTPETQIIDGKIIQGQ